VQKTPKQNLPNIKSLLNKTTQEQFKNDVSRQLWDERILQSSDDISKIIISSLTTAAQRTLPPVTKKTGRNEIWKDDNHLNNLIKECYKTMQGSDRYKVLTKRIKTQVNALRKK